MLCPGFKVASLLALLAAGILASDFEEALRRDFGLGLLYPRAAELAAFFTGDLGGVAPQPITESSDSSRPFEVGGDTFPDFESAAQRACDNQHNTCADLSNNKTGDFTVSACDTQQTQCEDSIKSATQTTFGGSSTSTQSASSSFFSSNSEFDFYCES